MDVRDRLREALESKRVSARAASLRAGLSDSLVHKFLTGANASITIDNLNKIAEALAVPPEWLAYGSPAGGDSAIPDSHLTEEEIGWAQTLGALESEDRATVLGVAQALLRKSGRSRALHDRTLDYRAG